jgi:hypothetical protein
MNCEKLDFKFQNKDAARLLALAFCPPPPRPPKELITDITQNEQQQKLYIFHSTTKFLT